MFKRTSIKKSRYNALELTRTRVSSAVFTRISRDKKDIVLIHFKARPKENGGVKYVNVKSIYPNTVENRAVVRRTWGSNFIFKVYDPMTDKVRGGE